MSRNPSLLQFCAAFTTELGAGLVLFSTFRANRVPSDGRSAFTTEFSAGLDWRTALGTFQHAEGLSATAAELSVASRFPTMGTDGGALLNVPVPDSGVLRGFVNVATHGFAPRLGHIAALPRGTADA